MKNVKIQCYEFLTSGIKKTRKKTRKKKVKKFAFDHCKTCSERFVI